MTRQLGVDGDASSEYTDACRLLTHSVVHTEGAAVAAVAPLHESPMDWSVLRHGSSASGPLSFLSSLPPLTHRLCFRHAAFVSLPPYTPLFHEDDRAAQLYVVLQGGLAVFMRGEEEEGEAGEERTRRSSSSAASGAARQSAPSACCTAATTCTETGGTAGSPAHRQSRRRQTQARSLTPRSTIATACLR